mgnify:FL=1
MKLPSFVEMSLKYLEPSLSSTCFWLQAASGPMAGVLAVADEPLVSVDFRKTDVSTTIDSSLTMVMGDDMVKVVAWYDNEWGYSQRVVDLAEIVAAGFPGDGPTKGDPLEEYC